MALNPELNSILRFVDCCDGTEILFSGSLTINSNGSVYQYIGASPMSGSGGQLIPGRCYQIYVEQLPEQSGLFGNISSLYPIGPSKEEIAAREGCQDDNCAECNPQPLCECPEGYTYNPIGDNCVRETETIAEYSGTLLPIVAGDTKDSFSKFGVRLYPDITSLTWPLLGDGTQSTYVVNENNGAGAAVIPTANVQNEAFGSEVPGCVTGDTGGRLNKVGIWATGFPLNQELSFEFCVDIPGPGTKQYLIGIAGDNKIKLYIDGTLAVFLDAANNLVTRPFNHWHTFPITLTPGNHIIKLSGLNIDGEAAFGAEIYDITLTQFQANLLYPAVGFGNCGSTEAQLEPYILFSTKDYIGQSIPDPANPGVWSCPPGATLDECQGIPICKLTETVDLTCECYLVIPCDGSDTFISNDSAYEPYINSFVEVSGPEYTGCAYVALTNSDFCNDSTVTTVPTGIVCNCDLKCWWIQDSNGFLYVDDNNNLQSVSAVEANPYTKICSKIPPVPTEGTNLNLFNKIELGDCVDGVCPDLCFKLTNCENPSEIIYSNSDNLYQYAFGSLNVVEILDREGCWRVTEGDPEVDACDCLIDVVVVRSYTECTDCVKIPAYRLTSCTSSDVIYTELNLEAYIGRIIQTDCGCYEVELIDFKPTNPQIFQLVGIFDECVECTQSYYKLVDCKGEADDIYTYTDLSSYLNQTIKIENCEECWTVNEVLNPSEIYANAGKVTLIENYDDCDLCLGDLPCICTQITNHGNLTRTYGYLNCDNEYEEVTLQPGETSSRICALKWIPVDYCNCFTFKITDEGSTTYIATIIPGQILNGYPVYKLCENDPAECGTVSFNGTTWIIYDGNTGDALYELVDSTSSICPYGTWDLVQGTSSAELISYECPNLCTCVSLTIEDNSGTNTVVFNFIGFDTYGNPMYESLVGLLLYNTLKAIWELSYGNAFYTLDVPEDECPIGQWSTTTPNAPVLTSTDCTEPIPPVEFLPTDFFQTFGECKHGVCPPPIFKNNRTVRPGYNTPICTPEKYDMITCNFADVMYKMVLEKRYGITNCCPEDDDKWIVKKELIDLQALKDPNYKCSKCDSNCNSVNTCPTCNSEN